MQIPNRVPGFKWLVIFWMITAVLWSMLEGDLRRVLFFGLFSTLTGAAYLFQRVIGGRSFSVLRGLLIMGLWGLALGAGTVFMTLFLMVVKTGLHAHGPEFSMIEISEAWQYLPLWSLVGVLVGLGIGLLFLAGKNNGQRPFP
jgi:hypothetical protein